MISLSGFQKVLTDEFENLNCMHLLIVTWLHPDLYHANKEMNENELKLTNSREKKKKKKKKETERWENFSNFFNDEMILITSTNTNYLQDWPK